LVVCFLLSAFIVLDGSFVLFIDLDGTIDGTTQTSRDSFCIVCSGFTSRIRTSAVLSI
jgi:nitrate/TMAO reductase-like tetraheme cytochrome c subunit